MITREIEVGRTTCLLGFNAGKGYMPTVVFDATTIVKGSGGTNEAQTVTITGTPTGGTFTLTFRGQTTAAIAYNAAASAVEDALEALASIGNGNVRVTGGPGPGTPYVVTFINSLGHADVDVMTHTDIFTGGTSPAAVVTTPTAGSGSGYDPRFLVGSMSLPGTMVVRVTGAGVGDDTVKEYTGSGSIFGLVDGIEEFFGNSSHQFDRSMPLYGKQAGLVVDARKIKNYATYKSAIDTWAAANGVTVRYG